MTTFNQLLEEAAMVASKDELAESNLDDHEANLLEGLDELIFENGEEDFQARFDPAIDQYQFFNQSYISLEQDELEDMFNPDVSADLNNHFPETHAEEDLEEGADFLDNPVDYPLDFIEPDEQLHEEDESLKDEEDEQTPLDEFALFENEEFDELDSEEFADEEEDDFEYGEFDEEDEEFLENKENFFV